MFELEILLTYCIEMVYIGDESLSLASSDYIEIGTGKTIQLRTFFENYNLC
jgi:hypothetical protein